MEKRQVHFGIFIAISILLLVAAFILVNKISNEAMMELEEFAKSPEGVCELNSGEWLPEYNECEGISERECEQSGGTFEECASACRHDPDAEFCMMICVPVCKY